jgi:NADPH:quinone reductase-like Zn-dependent oxidoreductase
MRAIVLNSFGGVDQLHEQEVPRPIIRSNEVLIRSRAIGLNPVDVKTRNGKGQAAKLKLEDPMILGWDVSGEIVEAGNEVFNFSPGDEVFGMINLPGVGKTYAEYVAAPASHITHKPSNVSHEEAAAAALAAMTAWQALVDQAKLKRGQRILVHAASGGVGHYAVQFAKYIGAYVIGTSSGANRQFVLSLGADEHIDYKSVKFEDVCAPVDVVLDAIGGENIDRSLKVLKEGGTIISLPSGVSESVTDKAAAQGKRGIFFFVNSNSKDMSAISSLLAQGHVHSHVSQMFSFADIRAAHELLESGKTVGKIILAAPV